MRSGRSLTSSLVLAGAVAAGCSSTTRPVAEGPQRSAAITEKAAVNDDGAAVDPRALMTLDQASAEPPPLPVPATRPAGRPPADALVLYAKARDQLAVGHPQAAVDPLDRAIALDPYRYDLHATLGKAYAALGGADDAAAVAAYERAVELEPDHVDSQAELGRLLLARGETAAAIARLRVATRTTGYADDPGRAAAVDLYLARALQRGGYDKAALGSYAALCTKLREPSPSVRETPELMYVVERPDLLMAQMGEVCEHLGDWPEAVTLYQPAVERDPGSVEAQGRLAKAEAMVGRRGDRAAARAAIDRASDLVVRESASPASLDVVRDVTGRLGMTDGVCATLRRLVDRHPGDTAVRFALADTLAAAGRPDEAADLIEQGWRRSPGDVRLTVALTDAERRRGVSPRVIAGQLVVASARNPEAVPNLTPLWDELLRPGTPGRLSAADVAGLTVASPTDEPARLLWEAHADEDAHRGAAARAAISRAVQLRPPYPPAFRAAVDQTWASLSMAEPEKVDRCERLATAAATAGAAVLAAEVRGRSLVARRKFAEAAEQFAESTRRGGRSPTLQLAAADAAHTAGRRDPAYEQTLWHLAEAHPRFPGTYTALFDYYSDPAVALPDQAARAAETWAAADPRSTAALALRARVDAQLGRTAEADRSVDALLAADAADPDVVAAGKAVYARTGRAAVLIDRLEAYRQGHPTATTVAVQLARLYADARRVAEAGRVLDSARLAAGDDPGLLYPLAGGYLSIGDRRTSDAVLQQVLRLDPTHPAASNDLGFELADRGERLAEAEALVRVSVAADPDDRVSVDSLGWVLYKQGQFAEAQRYLQQAVGTDPAAAESDAADPSMLDHLGDALYRLSRPADAVRTWQRALAVLDRAPGEPPGLRLQLQAKVKQADASKPVGVAPLAAAVR